MNTVNLTFAFQSILKDCDSFTTARLLRHGKTKFDVIEQKIGLKIGEVDITPETEKHENEIISLVVEYSVDKDQYVAYLGFDDNDGTDNGNVIRTRFAEPAYLYDYEERL